MCQEGIQPTKNKGLAERGIRTPGTSFSSYNGLANSSFHSLVFGINSLCSGELPYLVQKALVWGLLCNYCATGSYNGLDYADVFAHQQVSFGQALI